MELWKQLAQSLNKTGLALWFMMFVGIILLVSLWILSVAAESTTTIELQAEVANYKSIRKEVAQQRALLEQVYGVAENRVVWADVFEQLLKTVPSGVQMTAFTGQSEISDDETMASLVIRGQAVTRNVLKAFESRLQNIVLVTGIESPTSNLLDRENPTFELKLLIQPATTEDNEV